MEKIQGVENRKQMIHRLVEVAISNALDFSQYQTLSERYRILTAKEILSEEDELEMKDILGKINHSSVHTATLMDFKMAMEDFGLAQEKVIDFLSHENAHANKAETLGVRFEKYMLTILHRDGKLIGQPSAIFDLDYNNPNIKKILRLITQAPEEYGNELSEGDKKDIKNL